MPAIKSSSDLRNNYNEISTFCHKHQEPVFITKNGQGDLAVMSVKLYESMNGRLELYRLLAEGRQAVHEGKLQPLDEAMAELRQFAKAVDNG